MKAIVYDKKQEPFRQRIAEVKKAVPNDKEVLLKVVSASINAADYRLMKMGMIPKLKVFGSAVSGIIESVGKNVQQFKPGDMALADLTDCGFGGLAEFAIVPLQALARKPENVSFEEAATLPVAATTALSAFIDQSDLQQNQKALIVGSSGGVGTFALQLAKHFGLNATAVCSTRNIDQATSLGADRVIDYTKEGLNHHSDSYDLIIAINGNYSLLGYKRMLKPDGKCVVVGGSLKQIFKSMLFGWLLSFGGGKFKMLSAKVNSEDLSKVAELMDQGKIKAVIEKRYSLDTGIEAIEYLANGRAQGKVIVNVSSVAEM